MPLSPLNEDSAAHQAGPTMLEIFNCTPPVRLQWTNLLPETISTSAGNPNRCNQYKTCCTNLSASTPPDKGDKEESDRPLRSRYRRKQKWVHGCRIFSGFSSPSGVYSMWALSAC